MQDPIEYKGKLISAQPTKSGKSWRWSYSIDNGPHHQCKDGALPTEEAAWNEAIDEAKRKIDRMQT